MYFSRVFNKNHNKTKQNDKNNTKGENGKEEMDRTVGMDRTENKRWAELKIRDRQNRKEEMDRTVR